MAHRIMKNRIAAHLRATMLAGLILAGGSFAALGEGQAYRVGANDVLQVTVYGQPSLTGLYPVDVDGNIGYPIVGNIPVSGLTINEIGEKIAGSLSQHIPGLTVTATINQYAPVFVVGDVKAPGKYQFRPGMVALELMALGGGAGKAETPALTAGMQLITVQQEYVDLQMQITAMTIRRARFEAELNGTEFNYVLPEQPAASKETAALTQQMLDGKRPSSMSAATISPLNVRRWKRRPRAMATK